MAAHSLEDLRRVIRRIETRRPKRPAAPPIEGVLGGELVDTGEGQLLVVRREFPLAYRHGRQPLGAALEAPLDLLSAVARAETPVEDARRLLFLDAETTGLAGGTGTYAFLVGAAWLEDDRLVLAQHFMRDFDEERSEEHTSELQSRSDLVCRLLLEKKKKHITTTHEHDCNNIQ